MVDTGNLVSYHRLQKNFDSLSLASTNISLLILTHSHFDHCRNAFAIQQHEHCLILMSEKEAAFTKTGYTPLPDGTFQLTRFISRLGNLIGKKRFGYTPFFPIYWQSIN